MKRYAIFGAALTILLASCSASGGTSNNNPNEVTWTISFETNGGSEVSPIKVKDGEKVSKPASPYKDGYAFDEWCVDSFFTIAFDWDTPITSDWTLYASWKVDASKTSSSQSSSSEDASSSASSSNTQNGHGPANSSLTSWYLVGEGSLWGSDGWTKEGGVQLYTNPANSGDKACILGLNFEVGDKFKVTDGGSVWFGYEKVDTASSSSNRGTTCFNGESDGYGGRNFKCTVAGSYDMYINGSGVFWIQDAAN